jgi:hypothetical protein
MPQPVQPPQVPAIIQSVSSQDAAIPNQSFQRTSSNSASIQTLQTKVLATPTPPESFAPESSPLTIAKSAALLGPPISVGEAVSSNQSDKKAGDSVRSPTQLHSPSSPPVESATTPAPRQKFLLYKRIVVRLLQMR